VEFDTEDADVAVVWRGWDGTGTST